MAKETALQAFKDPDSPVLATEAGRGNRERVERDDNNPLSLQRLQTVLTIVSAIGRGEVVDQSELRGEDTVEKWLNLVDRAVQELDQAILDRRPVVKGIVKAIEYGDLFHADFGKHKVMLKGGPRNAENLSVSLRERLSQVLSTTS